MLAMKGMRDYANNALGQKIQMWGKEKRFFRLTLGVAYKVRKTRWISFPRSIHFSPETFQTFRGIEFACSLACLA